jgi:hypothetical protein
MKMISLETTLYPPDIRAGGYSSAPFSLTGRFLPNSEPVAACQTNDHDRRTDHPHRLCLAAFDFQGNGHDLSHRPFVFTLACSPAAGSKEAKGRSTPSFPFLLARPVRLLSQLHQSTIYSLATIFFSLCPNPVSSSSGTLPLARSRPPFIANVPPSRRAPAELSSPFLDAVVSRRSPVH